jgi:serine/threonine protein kinase
MGEVYRARDTDLKREVAIKVLPLSVAGDAERLGRFQREAEVLASLNHPNIAHIHGLEKSDGTIALVMELVEGPTLADRVEGGPIPFDEALPIARQIAEALEAAHEQGIIHRDLKPANIKVRDDGTVKVLDFGLAKALDPASTKTPIGANSPTITSPALMTGHGVILGTAAYMSPEQARGRAVDKRTDIWAFGAVLFEMLAGVRPFDGEDTTEAIAAVVKTPPNWGALPSNTASAVVSLIQRCLEKDSRARPGDIAVAKYLLTEPGIVNPSRLVPVPVTSAQRLVPWMVAAGVLLIAAVVLATRVTWRSPDPPPLTTFSVAEGPQFTATLSSPQLSRDGRRIASRVREQNVFKLWVRSFDRLEGSTLSGTDGVETAPFWAPDGRALGFYADGKLKVVDVANAGARTLADAVRGYGGSWNEKGDILYATGQGGIQRVSQGGGEVSTATTLDSARHESSHRFPFFLPDGEHFLYLAISTDANASAIVLGTLGRGSAVRLVENGSKPEFIPPHWLVFLRDNILMVQQLDLQGRTLTGAPTRIAQGVASVGGGGNAGFSTSANATLVYRPGQGSLRQLAWVTRDGRQQGMVGAPGRFENPRLSPDGKRLAVYRADNGGDIWLIELDTGASTRFTSHPASDNEPLWSPDGAAIAFVSNRDGVFNIYKKSVSGIGEDELLLKTPNDKMLNDWSKDGRYILYQEAAAMTQSDLWMLPLEGDRKPVRITDTPFSETVGAISPDGRHVLFTSDESGARQVYVQEFPVPKSKRMLSVGPLGSVARWRPDGKEIFYDAGGPLMAADVTESTSGELRVGPARLLFSGMLSAMPHNLDVTDDGARFLVLRSPDAPQEGGAQPFVVVLNSLSSVRVPLQQSCKLRIST